MSFISYLLFKNIFNRRDNCSRSVDIDWGDKDRELRDFIHKENGKPKKIDLNIDIDSCKCPDERCFKKVCTTLKSYNDQFVSEYIYHYCIECNVSKRYGYTRKFNRNDPIDRKNAIDELYLKVCEACEYK